ncbi:hypothetical protein [Streptomyces sp. NPDC048349]
MEPGDGTAFTAAERELLLPLFPAGTVQEPYGVTLRVARTGA